ETGGLRLINDGIYASRLIADLNAESGCYIKKTFGVERHSIGAALRRFVGRFQTIEGFAIGERSVGLNLERPDPFAASVSDEEQRLIGRGTEAVGKLDAGVNHALVALRVDEPDAMPRWIGEVDLVALGDCDVIRVHLFGEHRLFAVWCVGDDPFAAGLADV